MEYTIENIELKPCPFCGGEAKASSWHNCNYPIMEARIECTKCYAQSGTESAGNKLGCHDASNGLHIKKAADIWNKRVEGE